MMYYKFVPLDKQCDFGFGVTGDAFRKAAEKLEAVDQQFMFDHSHLPINFLYRHAIELYLKSIIIIIHRSLGLTYGDKSADAEPYVIIKEKWTLMYRIHSIGDLYAYFKYLLVNNREALENVAKTNWLAIPLELDASIAVIEKADSYSTFFRYPVTRDVAGDQEKSSWKETSFADVVQPLGSDGTPVKAFLELGENDEVVNSYKFDREPLKHLRKALQKASELLAGAHVGLRAELAGGK